MSKYRKKPVVIEATQWFKDGDHPAVTSIPPDHPIDRHAIDPGAHGWVETLEGGHIVTPGDWIITGVKGEHYPCKPDIFAATYEPASLPPEQDAQPTLRINRAEWRSLSPEAQSKLEKITGALHPDTRRARAEAAEAGRRVPLVAAATPAQASEMDDAIAAGDGTLHGAIDHWQERALAAEQAAQPSSAEDLLADFCEASGTYFAETYRPSTKTRQMVSNPIRRDDLLMLIRTARGMEAQVQEPLSEEDLSDMARCPPCYGIGSRLRDAVAYGRAVERACAKKWGVQLTKEGGNG